MDFGKIQETVSTSWNKEMIIHVSRSNGNVNNQPVKISNSILI